MLDTLTDPLELYSNCRLCPHGCGVDRSAGETGFCGVGHRLLAASHGPHFGEEPVLVGRGGSGTVFLAGCNLACVFCQNHDISRHAAGRALDTAGLADVFLELQRRGCVNLNLVTPTHFTPGLLLALGSARERGFNLPVVYNCGGYESVETLRILAGQVDVYLPDAKYGPAAQADELSGAADYFPRLLEALVEMEDQVGVLETADGVAVRGLIIRHLVLPGELADSFGLLERLAATLRPGHRLNVMGQYRPCYRANEFPGLNRRPTRAEVAQVRRLALELGFSLSG
jgi:putative pyruvate formate lyase activating enzyme